MEPSKQKAEWDEVKERAKAAWALGDYARVAEMLQPAADRLVEACSISQGTHVLDVAAGTGNVAIAAAKKGAKVVASDLTPSLIEIGERRCRQEGVDIEWFEADAEALPFETGRFDCVTSAFGAIFAPRAARAASELVRVARSGGIVGMANWTPEGYSGQLFSRMAKHLPAPPEGSDPPVFGGTPVSFASALSPSLPPSTPRSTRSPSGGSLGRRPGSTSSATAALSSPPSDGWRPSNSTRCSAISNH